MIEDFIDKKQHHTWVQLVPQRGTKGVVMMSFVLYAREETTMRQLRHGLG